MIRQRIKAGLKRIAQGVKLGRPKIDRATECKVRKPLAKGVGNLKVAKSRSAERLKTYRRTETRRVLQEMSDKANRAIDDQVGRSTPMTRRK
jgi:hypothetical protein